MISQRNLAAGVVLAGLLLNPAMVTGADRLVLEDRHVTVDQPVWLCVRGDQRPVLLHIDGIEHAEPSLFPEAAGAGEFGRIHLVVSWPEHGPLALLQEIDPRPRTRSLPSWGEQGHLGVGEYLLSADGFAPETLVVRQPTASERRSRALLARAWLHVEAGDSSQAAKLIEGLLALDGESPFAEQAYLALLDVLPFTRYGQHPVDWLAEWVARHHSACIVGEGIRRWLACVDESEGRRVLAELVAGYPQTLAAREARQWLSEGSP